MKNFKIMLDNKKQCMYIINKLEIILSGFAKATENRSLSKASMVDPVVSNENKYLVGIWVS